MKQALILHAPGTNRDGDLAFALQQAGAEVHIRPLTRLREERTRWLDYDLLALPGGFSYGDALGAGRLWALDLQTWFADQMQAFVASGRPVIGICNGFQALVKSGILPGDGSAATLTHNASGHFECRWVTLVPNPACDSFWLRGLEPFTCPVAHGEGRFLAAAQADLSPAAPAAFPANRIALRYALPDGRPAAGAYPANPNGSPGDVAAIVNPAGNVLGLMPHPEDHIHPYQHPAWTRGHPGGLALPLLRNAVRA
ncbi:MAG: phosphoribosylformylglycinamidine synthase I [Anaerolineales bacterium]